MNWSRRYKWKVWGVNLLTAGIMIPILFPFYWLAVSALQEPRNLLRIPPKLIPESFSFHYIKEVFSTLGLGQYLFNSVSLSLISTAIVLLFAALAAYSYTVYRYKGRETASRLVLFVYMFPHILVVIPLYILLTRVSLINTHLGLIITNVAFNLPVSIWVLQAYFSTIPKDLMEAGVMDGLTKLEALPRIYLPVALPGLAAAGVMTFIGVWNEFLFANTFIITDKLRTLPVIIVDYNTREAVMRGEVLASSLIIAIPSFLFALFAQRYLVGGLTAGSTKL
jgi:multiple sugar transport system permease protein